MYEVASAVAGLEADAQLSGRARDDVWELIDVLDSPSIHRRADALVAIALRLGRSVHGAAYIDLALRLPAELWTLDGKLARNAASVGFPVTLAV